MQPESGFYVEVQDDRVHIYRYDNGGIQTIACTAIDENERPLIENFCMDGRQSPFPIFFSPIQRGDYT